MRRSYIGAGEREINEGAKREDIQVNLFLAEEVFKWIVLPLYNVAIHERGPHFLLIEDAG